MRLPIPTCSKRVDTLNIICPFCERQVVKNGYDRNGKQRYLCKYCHKSLLSEYTKLAFGMYSNTSISSLLREGCSIRGIARLIGICTKTIINRIKYLAAITKKPMIVFGKSYEMDELRTFIQRKDKPVWIAYAVRQDTREVVDFKVGNRSNKTLSRVVDTILQSRPKVIHTDKLINYKTLIPDHLHKTKVYGINHIERHNLTLRTHLKRLSRRSICFSRSKAMLEACLKIYFWGS